MRKAWAEGRFDLVPMGIGVTGHRDDIGHFVRSTWEANIARLLLMQGVEYIYEPKVFFIEGGRQYRPDFYIPSQNLYLEIKGYDTSEAKSKRRQAREMYGVRIILVGPKRYRRAMEGTHQYDDHLGLVFE